MDTPIRAAWAATILSLAGLLGLCPPAAHAQCPRWLTGPGQGILGTNGSVYAFTTMPNGDLIAAGNFSAADSVLTNLVARWTGSSWQSIGAGGVPRPNPYADMIPSAVAASPAGEIYLGGFFSGSTPIYYITRWDGSTWSRMGSGVDNTVRAIAVMPNGDVIAAGDFANAGGAPASRIARWNAASGWAPLGLGLAGGTAYALAVLPNGNLLVGGDFQTAGGIASPNLAVWNGASWSPFTASLFASPNAVIRALLALPDSTIYAGGNFVTASGGLNIIKWTGSSWAPLGAGVNNVVRSITQTTNGDIAVGGDFTLAGGSNVTGLAAWNGIGWRRIGSNAITQSVNAVAPLPNNEVAIGVVVSGLPAYDGLSNGDSGALRSSVGVIVPLANDPGFWGLDTATLPVTVSSLVALSGGDIIAAGTFTRAGNTNVNNVGGIARWDGSRWSRFGAGVNISTGQRIKTLLALPNNNLIAAGDFTAIDGVPAANIALWDGSSWSPLGSGVLTGGGFVEALLLLPNGNLLASGRAATLGQNALAQWNGSAWSALPSAVLGAGNSRISSLLALPNGNILAGGAFTTINGVSASCIAMWNGAAWSPLGSGLIGTSDPNVSVLRMLPNGNILAGGSFLTSGANDALYVAEWNGSTWTSYGALNSTSSLNGRVSSLLVLPDSTVFATGSFYRFGSGPFGTYAMYGFSKWNGAGWDPVSGGVYRPTTGANSVDSLLQHPNGEIVLGGKFTITGQLVSTYWGRYTLTGIPTIAKPLAPQTRRVRQTVTFNASPASGYDSDGPLTYQWQRSGATLVNGPTSTGSVISGASTSTLTIENLALADAGQISYNVANSCGGITSNSAALSILPSCPGDANADGVVNFLDLNLVLGAFGSAVAPFAPGDVNGDGRVDFTDLNLVLANFGGAC